jgi:hypothetical protein
VLEDYAIIGIHGFRSDLHPGIERRDLIACLPGGHSLTVAIMHCGTTVVGQASPGPKPEGVMTLQRSERPKVFLDTHGKAIWLYNLLLLYNGVGLDAGSRPFTMATPILEDVPS